jgi:hypothetical protein
MVRWIFSFSFFERMEKKRKKKSQCQVIRREFEPIGPMLKNGGKNNLLVVGCQVIYPCIYGGESVTCV